MSLSSYKVDAFDDMMPGMFGSNYDVYPVAVGEEQMYGSFDAMPNNGGGISSMLHSGVVPCAAVAPSSSDVEATMMDIGVSMDLFGGHGGPSGHGDAATSDAAMSVSEELDSLDTPISPRSVASHPPSPRAVTLHVHGPSSSFRSQSVPSVPAPSANNAQQGVEDLCHAATFVSWDGFASESTLAAFPSTFRSASPGLLDAQLSGSLDPHHATSYPQYASSCDYTDVDGVDSAPSSPTDALLMNKKRKFNTITPSLSQQQQLPSIDSLPMPAASTSKRAKHTDAVAAVDMLPFNVNAYWMQLQHLMQQQQQQQNGPNIAAGVAGSQASSNAAAAAALQLQLQMQLQMQMQLRAAALVAASSYVPTEVDQLQQQQPAQFSTNFHAKAAAAAAALAERERRVRPKVVPEKGAIQCQGFNRKKNVQCRNAALMEFIGPRPQYCAEHIDLDPSCMYTKCRSEFHKIRGDGKGCREVVLKEFSFCHKHYTQSTDKMVGVEGFATATKLLGRVSVLLTRLESEAALAKKHDPDLFQRKHKLIPKFQQMYKVLEKRLSELVADGYGTTHDITLVLNEAQAAAAAAAVNQDSDDASNGSSETATPSSSLPASPSSSHFASSDFPTVVSM